VTAARDGFPCDTAGRRPRTLRLVPRCSLSPRRGHPLEPSQTRSQHMRSLSPRACNRTRPQPAPRRSYSAPPTNSMIPISTGEAERVPARVRRRRVSAFPGFGRAPGGADSGRGGPRGDGPRPRARAAHRRSPPRREQGPRGGQRTGDRIRVRRGVRVAGRRRHGGCARAPGCPSTSSSSPAAAPSSTAAVPRLGSATTHTASPPDS